VKKGALFTLQNVTIDFGDSEARLVLFADKSSPSSFALENVILIESDSARLIRATVPFGDVKLRNISGPNGAPARLERLVSCDDDSQNNAFGSISKSLKIDNVKIRFTEGHQTR
jgi:hypothetical protein